jgi:hypothetical protein
MNSVKKELDELLELIDTQYYSYPFVCMYQYIISFYNDD